MCLFLGFEELANFCHRLRHPTDTSSVTGASSGVVLHDTVDAPDSVSVDLPPMSSGAGRWFQAEIARLKFGKSTIILTIT